MVLIQLLESSKTLCVIIVILPYSLLNRIYYISNEVENNKYLSWFTTQITTLNEKLCLLSIK